MPTSPVPSGKEPAEGSRDVIDSELKRTEGGNKDQPSSTVQAQSTRPSPGDEAPPGTPGTGEDICPVCRGSGVANNNRCPNCEGTGRITKAIGGA